MPTVIDFRSDTVTKPVDGMRRAMFDAVVGDDVYGEDPTVVKLENTVAALLGKEAALYVPSGTMSNQLALLVHTERATEVILERHCHIFNHEGAAGSWLSGVQLNPLDGNKGILTASDIAPYLRVGQYGEPSTSLICLENTHNLAGGRIHSVAVIEGIRALAIENKIPMHLDGARLWNASAATGVAESAYASYFDTVSVCLSKGLGAPVGSVLVGSRAHINKARHFRSRLGGSMRQSGVIAAAGLYALENHRGRLKEDHRKARELASALNNTTWFSVDADDIESNIVFFHVTNNKAFEAVKQLKAHGILVSATRQDTIRAVTHLDISDKDIEQTKSVLNSYFSHAIIA